MRAAMRSAACNAGPPGFPRSISDAGPLSTAHSFPSKLALARSHVRRAPSLAGSVQLDALLPSRQPELARGPLAPRARISGTLRPLAPKRPSRQRPQTRRATSSSPLGRSAGDLGQSRDALGSSRWALRAEPARAQAPLAPQEAGEAPAVQRVAVFWDLDNKQPLSVAPHEVVLRLRDVARQFGYPVDILAYANVNAFEYVPERVRAERRQQAAAEARQELGLEPPVDGVQCGLCGRRFAGTAQLRRHFVQLHQKEHRKRMAHLNALGPGKRRRAREKLRDSVERYQDAAAGVLQPKRGYGLMPELRRAGVHVRLVSRAPQAADEALIADMRRAMRSGMVAAVLLISDDRGYSHVLDVAERTHGLCTVVVGSAPSLQGCAYAWLSWDDINAGAPHVLNEAAAASASWQRRCLGLSTADRHEPVFWDVEPPGGREAEGAGLQGQDDEWKEEAWEEDYLTGQHAVRIGEHEQGDSQGVGREEEDWEGNRARSADAGMSAGASRGGTWDSSDQWESESDEWEERPEKDENPQWDAPGDDEDGPASAVDQWPEHHDDVAPRKSPRHRSEQDTSENDSANEALGAWRSYEELYKDG